jgi:hypothetical protein
VEILNLIEGVKISGRVRKQSIRKGFDCGVLTAMAEMQEGIKQWKLQKKREN